jgi:protein-tyrosine phosphatase
MQAETHSQNGLINFRDFGGCPTASGRRVRRDRLYRSGQFANVPADAIARVLELDFQVIVDLRDVTERNTARSPWPATYEDRVLRHDRNLSGIPPHLALLGSDTLTPQAVARYYENLYAELPFDPLYRALFARAIGRLVNATGRVLIHCAVGKDRTGILCALVLSTLHVDREAILADFMRSSKAASLVGMKTTAFEWARKQYGREISEATVDALLDVEAAYLHATFERIERECGSVAGYLATSGISAEVTQRLHEGFLE